MALGPCIPQTLFKHRQCVTAAAAALLEHTRCRPATRWEKRDRPQRCHTAFRRRCKDLLKQRRCYEERDTRLAAWRTRGGYLSSCRLPPARPPLRRARRKEEGWRKRSPASLSCEVCHFEQGKSGARPKSCERHAATQRSTLCAGEALVSSRGSSWKSPLQHPHQRHRILGSHCTEPMSRRLHRERPPRLRSPRAARQHGHQD